MSPNTNITPQAIQRIRGGSTDFRPTLQVLDIKKIQNPPGQAERYKMVVSDGSYYQQAMLATQLNQLVASNQLQNTGLVSLQEFICNEVQGRKIIIILRMEIVTPSVGDTIGNPVEYKEGGGHAPPQPAAPAPHLNTMQGAQVPYQPRAAAPPAQHQPPPYQANAASAGRPAVPQYGGGGGFGQGAAFGGGGGGSSGGFGGGYGGGGAPRQGAVVRDDHHGPILPISELNPYQNRWTIKARVTSRSPIKTWSNAKGEGKLFSVDLLDEYGSEIRGTFFKDACDQFYNILEAGKVFTFSGGRLKIAQKQYSSIKNNYEITFDVNSDIRPVDDDQKIQKAVYSFKKIQQIEQVEPNTTIDLIGVVKTVGPESSITTKKDGRSLSKRELTIVDNSGSEVRLTLWGDEHTSEPERWENHPIVAFKNVKVSDFNGRSLGTIGGSSFQINPELPEALELHNWWYTQGSTAPVVSISSGGGGGGGGAATFDTRHYLTQIKDDYLGHAEKADYIDVKATITYIKSDPDPWYKACNTGGDCKRKVTEEMSGYRCEKCQRTMPECAYRYILSLSATDFTGSTYLSCFDEQAIQILGKTAEELHTFKSSDMTARYEAVFQEANFSQYVFRVRVKVENVNDEQRVKCNITTVRPINYVQECRDLVQAIKAYQ